MIINISFFYTIISFYVFERMNIRLSADTHTRRQFDTRYRRTDYYYR